MRIGINLLYLLPGIVGGTETYAAGLLHGMAATAPDDEFLIFVNQDATDWPIPAAANFTRIVCPVDGKNRGARYLFEQLRLPGYLRRHQLDLVHSLGYVGPRFCPCPSVLTIPDPNYIDLAHTMPMHRRLPLRFLSTQAARNADAVITISNFSRKRLSETLHLPASAINVIHLAPRLEMSAGDAIDWPELRNQYNIREPYLVAFGGGAIHKNIPTLLNAYTAIHGKYPHALVLIGHLPSNVELSAFKHQPSHEPRVIVTGYVPGEHIRPLLSHAELFIFPSLYEGFGLPVLEAQQAGVVVACSTAGSLPEVAGDGARYFDPYSVESITAEIDTCLSDTPTRDMLRRKGCENLQRFSWEKTASATVAVYRKALRQIQ
jgi:glycosyltransferase involved in cell wall biosynthesis